ncbi:MAG: hypothetical protein IJF43_00370, partial [Firmicutes bacterium]|nr:hypothetical protein [Bacillota bacterium]
MKTKNVEEELYLASEIETTEQDVLSNVSVAEETASLYCVSGSGSDCEDCESNSNSMETAYELPLSTWVSGSIVNELDAIWFKFTTNSGTSLYTIETRGSLDTIGTLYNSQKQQLAIDDDGGSGSNFCVLKELNYRTTYYVEVMSVGTYTGDFEVRVEPYSSGSSGSGSTGNTGSSSDSTGSSSCGSSCCTMEGAHNLKWRKSESGCFTNDRTEYWFKLTANIENAHYNEQTGDYWVEIFPDVPVRGALYYSDGSLIKYDESDDTLDNYHFSLKQSMEWGEVCYLQLKALEEGNAYFFVIGN